MLAVAILAGSSIAISQQRYRDAATTLQTFIQTQYNDASNVINDRNNKWQCDAEAVVTEEKETDGPIAGASDCVILGKFIQFKDGGKTVVSSDVIGRQYIFDPVTNDVDAFKQYKLAWAPVGQERKEVDWGASLVRPDETSFDSFNLFILRSPFSGVMRTFSYNSPNPIGENAYPIDTDAVITSFNTQETLCLNSPDFTTFQRLGVIIRPGATSASSIELLGEGSGC